MTFTNVIGIQLDHRETTVRLIPTRPTKRRETEERAVCQISEEAAAAERVDRLH